MLPCHNITPPRLLQAWLPHQISKLQLPGANSIASWDGWVKQTVCPTGASDEREGRRSGRALWHLLASFAQTFNENVTALCRQGAQIKFQYGKNCVWQRKLKHFRCGREGSSDTWRRRKRVRPKTYLITAQGSQLDYVICPWKLQLMRGLSDDIGNCRQADAALFVEAHCPPISCPPLAFSPCPYCSCSRY